MREAFLLHAEKTCGHHGQLLRAATGDAIEEDVMRYEYLTPSVALAAPAPEADERAR